MKTRNGPKVEPHEVARIKVDCFTLSGTGSAGKQTLTSGGILVA
jgi:hypothetical protein